ncbi:EAL domain-containing protein [Sulfuriflexus sp.]|uniref:EAL domain-containing protein n=1 Tax=Sulfuriflexus sp. TaxID=2015443 RepID=UPI0028CC68AE|nr:EAL domain-containing protein [Sulfuriflexus sp.]MDT8404434.1 EAL domain-containing protein [Sulfuriflexus sp.]
MAKNDLSSLAAIRARFTAIVALSFIVMPFIAHAAAATFNLAGWADLQFAMQQALLPLFICFMLFWIIRYAWLLFAPIERWLRSTHATRFAPPDVHQRLQNFGRNYWGFYLCYVLIAPQIYFWSTTGGHGFELATFGQLILLQLVVAILVGLPLYLMAIDTLGRVVSIIGITAPIFSIKSKLMLVGGFVPLLTSAVLMLFYWHHTGYQSPLALLVLALLGLVNISITALTIRTTTRSLRPVQQVLTGNDVSGYEQLAQLRPQSTDEIGYLTQTLSTLFQHLGNQRSHTRAIFDTSSEGIIVINQQGLIVTFNPAAERLFGYRAVKIIGQHCSRLFANTNLQELAASDATERELDCFNRAGEPVTISLRVSEMQQSGICMFTCLVADISKRKAAERKLRAAEARYRDLVETAHDLVWSLDPQGQWTYLNNASSNIYGYSPAQMLGRNITEFSDPGYLERDSQAFAQVLQGNDLVHYVTVHSDAHGNRHYLSFNATGRINDSGEVTHILGTAHDITEQKAYEKQLAYQAEHDSLTGLFNRHYFQEELERLVARIARSGTSAALFYIDLDQFKYVNDTLGHAAGDRLLLEVTDLFKTHIREGDLLARFGGDEFTLLLYNIEAVNVKPSAEKLRLMLENYSFFSANTNFNVTCSIGVVIIDNYASSADEVLAQADLACNLAKNRGRNRSYIYDPEDKDKLGMAEDMGWAARVREVLDNDRFELAYQPIVGINDGNIESYEVLLRMPFDDGQTILPGGFMPAAERFGLIHNIDRWTVARSIRTLARLRDDGNPVRFAINLSGRAFEDHTLLPLIRAAIDETGIEPSSITFEITETAAIANLNAASRFIAALRDIGCRFALDDFGTGFCSFTYLKHLPVDTLKIDGTFVQGLAGSPVDQAMVNSMNQVAHALGKRTIAESVENEATLILLKEIGVDYAQGHFLGRPAAMIN